MKVLNIFILQSDYEHFQPTLSLLKLFLCHIYLYVCIQLYTYYILYTHTERINLSIGEVTDDIKVGACLQSYHIGGWDG